MQLTLMNNERDDHFSVFSAPVGVTRYPTGGYPSQSYSREQDFCYEYFKYNELKRRGLLNRFAPNNPYVNDFNEYVDAHLTLHKDFPESESIRLLHMALERKHTQAIKDVAEKYGD